MDSRSRGELFEHSEPAHVMRSKIAGSRPISKNVYRQVGETVCHESGVKWRRESLSKSRRALFGEDFREIYELLQNRFLFVEAGNDEYLFLEHYVLLGNFMNDPDRSDVFDSFAARFGS